MRWLVGIITILIVCIAAYIGSAMVSVTRLVSAVRAGNGAEVIARTNLPRLRHSLVDQVLDAYLARIGQKREIKPLERMVINTYGATLADDLINRLITPANLTVLLKTGTVRDATQNIDIAQIAALGDLDVANVPAMLGRLSPIKPVEFALRLGADDNAGSVSMHFESGGWKLSGINLPKRIVRDLAERLPTR